MPSSNPFRTGIVIAAAAFMLGVIGTAIVCSPRQSAKGRIIGIGRETVEVVLVSGEKMVFQHATEWHSNGVLRVDFGSDSTTCIPVAQVHHWSSTAETNGLVKDPEPDRLTEPR